MTVVCPTCTRPLDGETCVTEPGASPAEGDVSVCIYCGTAFMFLAKGKGVRPVTPEEIERLPKDMRIALSGAMAVAAIFRAKYPHRSTKGEKESPE